MQPKYGLEDHPGFAENLIYGLQWLAVALPYIIILGQSFGRPGRNRYWRSTVYAEIVRGDGARASASDLCRTPDALGSGPSTVLLIGILASQEVPLRNIQRS